MRLANLPRAENLVVQLHLPVGQGGCCGAISFLFFLSSFPAISCFCLSYGCFSRRGTGFIIRGPVFGSNSKRNSTITHHLPVPPASILVPRPSPWVQRKCAAGRGSQAPEKIRRHRTKREQKRWTAEPARKKKKKKREKEARKGEGGKAAPGPVEIIHDGPDGEKETQARGGSMRKLGGQVDRATEGLARLDWLDWPVSGDEGRQRRQRRASPPEPRGGVQYPNGTQKGGDAALVNCSDELANASSGPCVAMKVLNPSPLTPVPVRRLFSFPSRSHLLLFYFVLVSASACRPARRPAYSRRRPGSRTPSWGYALLVDETTGTLTVHSLSTHWTVQYGTPAPTNNTHQHHLDQASPRLTSPPSPMSHVPCPFRLVLIKRSGIRRLAFALNSRDACNAPLPLATQQLGCLERLGLLQNRASPSPGDLFGTWSQQVSIWFPLTTLYSPLLVTARHCSALLIIISGQTNSSRHHHSVIIRSLSRLQSTYASAWPTFLLMLTQTSFLPRREKQSNRPHNV
ncbi:hypothetical protein BKA56DRAFT_322389 [Ilyonectria sp. MPI-CAGE-AT-0026]|nr:hypothetical protein BKA56DRAFT_322389 [Ilyonectria sp. MPI-CAGE-AT-0026]